MEIQNPSMAVALATPEDRSHYLRRLATWTLGGLTLTAIVSVISTMFIAPLVFQGGTWAVIAVVYGSFLLAQTVVRKMVYGQSKVAGFVLGTALQGIALGFLLLITLSLTKVEDGLTLIGQCLLITVLAAAAMLVYVIGSKRSFSMLGAGLSMLMLPMLGLMALQLVFPLSGTAGIVVAAVFLLVSVGAMLYNLNLVVNRMDATMHVEGAYEVTLSVVVLFWNLLSLMNRLRRR
jgi:FtsH-binding integral membrane protein